jgi:hypothetical protein
MVTEDDPLRQLEQWGREVERRELRAQTGRRLQDVMKAPIRAARRHRRPVIIVLVTVGLVALFVAISALLGAHDTDHGLGPGGPALYDPTEAA